MKLYRQNYLLFILFISNYHAFASKNPPPPSTPPPPGFAIDLYINVLVFFAILLAFYILKKQNASKQSVL